MSSPEKALATTEEVKQLDPVELSQKLGLTREEYQIFHDTGMRGKEIAHFKKAKFLSTANFIPQDFRGNPANCYIAVELADRVDETPTWVMQHLMVVHGKPGWDAAGAIYLAKKSKAIKRLSWEFDRTDKNNLVCTCIAETPDGRKITQSLSWKEVQAWGWSQRNGNAWIKSPDHMFELRTASWLIKKHFPEVLCGYRTQDELEDSLQNVTPSTGKRSLLDL